MNDWARHLSANDLFRRELEENSVLGGNVVVRVAEGDEAARARKSQNFKFDLRDARFRQRRGRERICPLR